MPIISSFFGMSCVTEIKFQSQFFSALTHPTTHTQTQPSSHTYTYESPYRRQENGATTLSVGMLRFISFYISLPSLPPLFILFSVSISVSTALSILFYSKNLRFLTLFFRSYFCLVCPFNYVFLYENLPKMNCVVL